MYLAVVSAPAARTLPAPSPSLTTLPPLALHALQCKRPQGSISQCHKRSPSVCCWLPLDGEGGGGCRMRGRSRDRNGPWLWWCCCYAFFDVECVVRSDYSPLRWWQLRGQHDAQFTHGRLAGPSISSGFIFHITRAL